MRYLSLAITAIPHCGKTKTSSEKIRKKGGNTRAIDQPKTGLKTSQYKILDTITGIRLILETPS